MTAALGFDWELHEARERLLGKRHLFSVSELYHENSKIVAAAPGIAHTPESLAVGATGFKRYTYSPAVELPLPTATGALVASMFARRSARDYAPEPLTLGEIGDLAYSASGLADERRRPAPSAGGLYPLELYIAALDVTGLDQGLYHYNLRDHRLDQVSRGDCRPELAKAIFIEDAVAQAAAAFILSGVFGRSKIKYGERAYRFVLLEAGHVMQNLLLAAQSARLAACPVGGFVDDGLNDLLQIDGVEEASLYAALVGRAP